MDKYDFRKLTKPLTKEEWESGYWLYGGRGHYLSAKVLFSKYDGKVTPNVSCENGWWAPCNETSWSEDLSARVWPGQVQQAPIGGSLTFQALEKANKARLPQFKNAKGESAHSEPDGSDWSLSDWMNAVSGEAGEAANIVKKIRRGDFSLDEARPLLGKELADVVTYLSILAYRAGIDLGDAVIEKLNEVSERVGSDVRLSHEGAYRLVTEKKFF